MMYVDPLGGRWHDESNCDLTHGPMVEISTKEIAIDRGFKPCLCTTSTDSWDEATPAPTLMESE